MTDIWVCANCRSVNNLRAKQCYQCRTPKDRAAVDPSEIDGTTKGRLRDIALPDYLPSKPFAWIAGAMILSVGVTQGLNTLFSAEEVAETVDETGTTLINLGAIGPLSIATFVVAAAALVAFGAWLSRAVGAMPALGLGYPAATPVTAFLEVFIPGLNLMRIPAILRDIIRRLEPQEGRGDVLIYAAWIGLFGGLILPRVGIYLGLFGADTIEEGARTLIIVRFLSTILVAFGAVTLVALIWWIEGRMADRRVRQLAGEPAPTPPDPGVGLAPLPAAAPDQPVISFRPQSAAGSAVGGTANSVPGIAAPGTGSVSTSASTAGAAAASGTLPRSAPDPVLNRPMTAANAASTGAAPPRSAPDPVLNRPITAATGSPVGAAAPGVEPPPVSAAAPSPTRDSQVGDPSPAASAAASPLDDPQAPSGDGPHLRVELAVDGSILASVAGEPPEPITPDELRDAAPALAEAGGSATVTHRAEAAEDAAALVATLRRAGVPTALESMP